MDAAIRKVEPKTTLETSGEDAKLHSKRVEKMQNYTRNWWRRCETTLQTTGEDSFDRFFESAKNFINPYNKQSKLQLLSKTTLETGGKDREIHSKRVEKIMFTLETSGNGGQIHSKRVYFSNYS
jgi:hypothetical protein